MNKIKICLPGGAGGNWLSNLIYSLESNSFDLSNPINYHAHRKSSNVILTHDVNDKSAVFLNGTGLFNIYLNVIKKLRIIDDGILNNHSVRELFELLASEASSKLFFLEERTDLSWDNIFTDPDRFIQTLYKILDLHNFNYFKNDTICMNSINEYKTTCVNPADHFDNFDSVYWLGWCNGICKHLYQDWPLVDSKLQMIEFLKPRRDFFREHTIQYIIQ